MKLMEVKDLSVRYAEKVVVRHVSFSLEEGRWLMIAGPNGAGKSTIVSAVSGGVPYDGEVLCRSRSLRSYRPGELARFLGVLTQNHYIGYSFSVREVVRLGRYAYTKGVFGGRDGMCEKTVDEALDMTGLSELADRSVLRLSGGELQRVFLAQLFAQDPAVLILDEPTNHLDLVYQKQLLELVAAWIRRPGRAVISVVHDLSLARAYGTEALLLKRGEVAAAGPQQEVFAPPVLEDVYGMDVQGWMRSLLQPWE